jgi:hypothetical protein
LTASYSYLSRVNIPSDPIGLIVAGIGDALLDGPPRFVAAG